MWTDKTTTILLDCSYEFFVYILEFITLETISVRRVGDDKTRSLSFEKVSHFKHDILTYSCSFGISTSFFYNTHIDISGIYRIFPTWIGSTSEFCSCLVHEVPLITEKFLDTKMSHESRSDISCYHRCLYGYRSTSTKWIEKGTAILPVCKCNECSSEIFFDWSISWLGTVPSFMERVSRDIEEDMSNIIYDKYENMNFCTIRCVWSNECWENRFLSNGLNSRYTRQFWFCGCSLDDDSFLSREIFSPVYTFTDWEKCIKIFGSRFIEAEVYSIGKSTPDEEFIEKYIFPRAFYETVASFYISSSEFFTFSFYEGLESWLTCECKVWFMCCFSFWERSFFWCMRDDFEHESECIDRGNKSNKKTSYTSGLGIKNTPKRSIHYLTRISSTTILTACSIRRIWFLLSYASFPRTPMRNLSNASCSLFCFAISGGSPFS